MDKIGHCRVEQPNPDDIIKNSDQAYSDTPCALWMFKEGFNHSRTCVNYRFFHEYHNQFNDFDSGKFDPKRSRARGGFND